MEPRFTITLVEYVRPNGQRKVHNYQVDLETEERFKKIKNLGFECSIEQIPGVFGQKPQVYLSCDKDNLILGNGFVPTLQDVEKEVAAFIKRCYEIACPPYQAVFVICNADAESTVAYRTYENAMANLPPSDHTIEMLPLLDSKGQKISNS